MQRANCDHEPSYGEDRWTALAADSIRELFETDCEVFFVFNGTAANSLALSSLSQSYHSILCHRSAHVETDECGAPEFFSNGTKVLLLDGEDGKINVSSIHRMVKRRTDIHYPKPQVISVTQSTELGTLYTPEEIGEIGAVASELGLKYHMDGARFANAVTASGKSPAELTWKVGVDVLCFGGAKNGMALGDLVVFFKPELAYEFDYRCKQAGQLASKMRFLAAPWLGMLKDQVWLKYASHANRMASLLADGFRSIPDFKILFPPQANAVFVEIPSAIQEGLKSCGWKFYNFIGEGGCRFMASWDTEESDVNALLTDVNSLAAA